MRMKNWKRFAAVAMSVMCMGTMVACGSSGSASNDSKTGSAGSSSKSQTITVVSREDGSGTRGAFIELFGIEEKDASGKKVDNTTDDATITNSTEVMMTTVAGDEAAIGYTSLGALNSSIKALKVDGAEATAANVKSGTYKISRPFNIATKGTVSEVTQSAGAFIDWSSLPSGAEGIKSALTTYSQLGASALDEVKVTTLQQNLDQLIPGLAALLLTLLCCWLLKKKVSPIIIIIALFVVGIVAHLIGIM